ncbi:hypothetical protein [Sphingomonas sp. 28-63-12]|uniref:hypothetical protein n=1 Tax=Sphingomonas sp. 28-63-12 TaxID=1970434 RepID=UPI000BD0049C|nr:MAG: hypothetical protein B7Y47_03125 [Sphingomonas sp. 28-63-12]
MSRGPDIGTALIRAIGRHAGDAGCAIEIVSADWDHWASATFAGARHQITLAAEACPAITGWLGGLAEAEFDISGHLVADLAVTAVRRSGGRIEAALEVLTVEVR